MARIYCTHCGQVVKERMFAHWHKNHPEKLKELQSKQLDIRIKTR